MKRPVRRSSVRIAAGKLLYTLNRYIQWYVGSVRYASVQRRERLPFVAASHRTPVYRKLRSLDMRLQHNKKQNLMMACECLDGIVVRPGETFSYWRLIGRPSARKGYLPGLVLFYGTLREGIGGGLCQLSNLIYWMTLYTPLIVTERYRHSYDVFPDSGRTQPFGSGATCVYPYRDLQIYNPTGATYQLSVTVVDDFLCGTWYSDTQTGVRYEVYQRDHSITHEFWGAYVRHNTIYRRETDTHGVICGDYKIAENHAIMMYEPYLEETEKREGPPYGAPVCI